MTYGTKDHGFIPLGKYSQARDSLLHYLVESEWGNESFGNTSEWGLYVWRISNDPADVAMVNTEFNSVIQEWLDENSEVTDSQSLRDEIVGHFIVSTNDQGFVFVEQFDSVADLDTYWQELEASYDAFYSEDSES